MTIIAGVLGWPISHSRSPLLHRHWIAAAGVDAVYLPFAVRPERFAAAASGLAALGVAGVNVTIPHKEQALSHADSATPAARAIGAANMLTVGADGRLAADNSDAFGFLAHLTATISNDPKRFDPALIIGAGGVARAAVYALADFGVERIVILNRTRSRAEALAALYTQAEAVTHDDAAEAIATARLVVNATSIGMQSDETPIDVSLSPSDAILFDTVYTPLETALLRAARQRGLATVDGLGMLMHQARAGARLWYGVDIPPDDALRAVLERSFEPV